MIAYGFFNIYRDNRVKSNEKRKIPNNLWLEIKSFSLINHGLCINPFINPPLLFINKTKQWCIIVYFFNQRKRVNFVDNLIILTPIQNSSNFNKNYFKFLIL
jgi:hypothetical protein